MPKSFLVCFLCLSGPALATNGFTRGDANGDGAVTFADYVVIRNWLWSGGPVPACMDAADVNDDGQVDLSDQYYLSQFLFGGGPNPPAPFPSCGQDPTSDSLTCTVSRC